AAYWRVAHELPGFPQEPGPVVIIWMTAMFGSIAHAPLAMLLMVAEMTGNLSLLGPAMIAVAVATLLVGDESIYRSQVATRADSPAHRHRFAFPLLTALPAGRAAVPVPMVDPAATADEIRQALDAARAQQAIVRREDGSLGEVLAADLREASTASTAESLSRPLPVSVQADWPLDRALDLLNENDRRWLPVVDGPGGEVLGIIDTRTLLRSYRRAASTQMRQLAPLAEEMETIEITITADAPIAHGRLADAAFPPGARVVALGRDGHTFVPDGATTVLPGDVVTVTFGPGTRAAVFERLLGTRNS
ncbi:MAG TPA: TrkA C-terminal domain-containing protein, partial [Tepidiformaceae bacterium]|nr:TrkA C-terminal domain-containing protein [Tepidiformaceae bacterium]